MRVPYVKRGDNLTALRWNQMAGVVNDAIAAPRDMDEGITEDEVGTVVLRKLAEVTEVVRVYSPDSDDVYVDVERILALTVRNTQTGRTEEWDLR